VRAAACALHARVWGVGVGRVGRHVGVAGAQLVFAAVRREGRLPASTAPGPLTQQVPCLPTHPHAGHPWQAQWVHPAVNGVAVADDPCSLHADLHTYLHGGAGRALRWAVSYARALKCD
jgi:hypothetical protein